MAIIETSITDLENLVGRKLPRDAEKLNDILQYAKCEVERLENDNLAVSVEDANRPDLLSAEGIARELRGPLGVSSGLANFKVGKSGVTVTVDKKLEGIRAYAACAVVKGVKVTEPLLVQLIQLQEKMNGTYGRNRKVVGTGIYNFDKIKAPIRYTVTDPEEHRFVPLDMEEALTPKQVLQQHPKGQEFGHLIADKRWWPVFIDANDKVLSMPPIINSNYSGRVDSSATNLFIEATGTAWAPTLAALNITAAALAERGGKVQSVVMMYGGKKIVTPDFRPGAAFVKLDETNERLGLALKPAEAAKLLKRARYGVKKIGPTMKVDVPAYRVDVMHPVDIIEDIAIQYGYQKFEPIAPALPTVGAMSVREKFSDKVREVAIGLGLQEVLNFTLTNRREMFGKMSMPEQRVMVVANPVSSEFDALRGWTVPSLLGFLAQNRMQDYPQMIFEVGDCVVPDALAAERSLTRRKLAIAGSHVNANLTEARSMVESVLKNLGQRYEIVGYNHPSFIPTRCAEVRVRGRHIGFYGEVHPAVLEAWKLELPVIAIELDLDALMSPSA